MIVKKLPYKTFLKTFKFVPRFVVELLIENKKHEFLLVKRDFYTFVDSWHIPGGFLLKQEKINDCAIRLAMDELKIKIDAKQITQMGVFETINGDPRGHIIHLVVKLNLNKSPIGTYFSKIPPKTINYQAKILKKLGYT